MLWTLLAAAAQLSAPVPTNNWLTVGDTPAEVAGSQSVLVRLRLTILPDGHVQACGIEESNGNPRVDLQTCELARTRAVFRPAKSATGSPTYGVFRVPLLWKAPAHPPVIEGDIVVSVKELPNRLKSPVLVSVTLAVDSDGAISACIAAPPPGHAANHAIDPLRPLACGQILANYKARPAKDANNAAVASVQNAVVEFTTN